MQILQPDEQSITKAARALSEGLLVAFPTETVYGLGANANDMAALQRLYAAKGRPENHPVIVHISGPDKLKDWAATVPRAAQLLADELWPGPLTLILPKAPHVLMQVTGGQNTVGLRVPNHPAALALIKQFNGGIAAPSANKFGKLSPTCALDIVTGFAADEIAYVIDGGICEVGIESTIVDFAGEQPRILRPGMILPEQIEKIIRSTGSTLEIARGKHSNFATATGTSTAQQAIRAPGMLASHYAPVTPLKVVSADKLHDCVTNLLKERHSVCVLAFAAPLEAAGELLGHWIKAPFDATIYARELYGNLRRLDANHCDAIVVESVPETEEWSGVADRLRRAAYRDPNELSSGGGRSGGTDGDATIKQH